MNSNDYEKDFNNQGVENVEIEAKSQHQDEENQNSLQVQHGETHQPQNPQAPKKKNRTLQFYKFLFYSMKTEIKVHEFYDLVRFSNQTEISLWILSLVLYFNSPPNFTNVFVWLHIIHIVRGIIGFIILIKLPRSYMVVEAMKNIPEKEMETKLFNDIARGIIKEIVIDPMQKMKGWLIVYFILTFINFVFDVIDFLFILSNIDKHGQENNTKIILLSFLIIAFLYLAIDFSYVFWTGFLKYIYPHSYLGPISNSFNGAIERLRLRFRIGKKETDIRQEAAVQNVENKNNLPNEIGGHNGHNVNPEHIQIDMGIEDKTGEMVYNKAGKNTHENYLDQQEENLDK